MKNYYIAKFRVIVDGQDHSFQTVSGLGYDPNIAKEKAKERVRKDNLGKQVTAVLMDEVVEGVRTVKIAYSLSKHYHLRTPIISMIYNVVFDNLSVDKAIHYLMRYPFLPDVDFI